MNKDGRFFDLQVNGYGGVDFNQDDLTAESLHRACERLRDGGVGGILATIITEEVGKMARRLENLVRLREQSPLAKEIIAGIHIEGPFLNETAGYRGAHPADAIRPANMDDMKRLIDAAGGLAKIVTLAPERDAGLQVTKWLAGSGVIVSAGHCNPDLPTLEAAIDAGLSMFTHLGNGCPTEMPRNDNIVQRVLRLRDRLWISFIADGAHIPFFVLENYIRLAGMDRTVIVTDAIAPAGLGPGRYSLGRWSLEIGEDMVARAPDRSHLVGAAITLARTVENLVEHVGLTPQEAQRLTCDNPRAAVGLK